MWMSEFPDWRDGGRVVPQPHEPLVTFLIRYLHDKQFVTDGTSLQV